MSQMSAKLNIQVKSPKTQSIDAVKSLLAYVGRPSEPLPVFVDLVGGVRLTRSKKGDCYYTTTSRDCSCPARAYNPGTPCKHMKALQIVMEGESIRPKVGSFKPLMSGLQESEMITIVPIDNEKDDWVTIRKRDPR